MNSDVEACLLSATGAVKIQKLELIQKLWSGYGEIQRVILDGGDLSTVVVKHVRIPNSIEHPRGWNTDLSHARKMKSYQVEIEWYRRWSQHCDRSCRVPELLAFHRIGDEALMIMEDLDANGFPKRQTSVNPKQLKECLRWLANFHATFMGKRPEGLWEVGTYWHLATRPDEWTIMDEGPLKTATAKIDQVLNSARYQTFVHGDAKLANFCFSESGNEVAAVDFQYVGGGCGMKDVAYFIGSCLDERECEAREGELLDCYFTILREQVVGVDFAALESEWRDLFPYAWADFHRFLKGWSPGHWKINSYSERMVKNLLRGMTPGAPESHPS